MVEIHIMQGEREMAGGNKSLGRFKLTGIPPAPRGIPQVQVAFDIDANGILQVTARDKTTGREQGITIQGASNLTESDVNRMVQEADKFAQQDRERKQRVEKRNNAKALTDRAQRRLREVTLDFGTQFVSGYRRRIETLSQQVLESLEKNDEIGLDRAQADLEDTLYELNREVRMQYEQEEENDNFFGAIKRTLTGEKDEDDYPYRNYRDDYSSSGGYRDVTSDRTYRNDNNAYEDYRNNERYKEYRDDSYRNNERYKEYRDDDYRNNERSQDERNYGNYRNEDRDRNYGGNNYYNDRDSSRSADKQQRKPSSNRNSTYEPNTRSSNKGRQNIPYQNNWDEDDDEWF
jgi:molecular chaperone DnaK